MCLLSHRCPTTTLTTHPTMVMLISSLSTSTVWTGCQVWLCQSGGYWEQLKKYQNLVARIFNTRAYVSCLVLCKVTCTHHTYILHFASIKVVYFNLVVPVQTVMAPPLGMGEVPTLTRVRPLSTGLSPSLRQREWPICYRYVLTS